MHYTTMTMQYTLSKREAMTKQDNPIYLGAKRGSSYRNIRFHLSKSKGHDIEKIKPIQFKQIP